MNKRIFVLLGVMLLVVGSFVVSIVRGESNDPKSPNFSIGERATFVVHGRVYGKVVTSTPITQQFVTFTNGKSCMFENGATSTIVGTVQVAGQPEPDLLIKYEITNSTGDAHCPSGQGLIQVSKATYLALTSQSVSVEIQKAEEVARRLKN